jgi:hypothetical protein
MKFRRISFFTQRTKQLLDKQSFDREENMRRQRT